MGRDVCLLENNTRRLIERDPGRILKRVKADIAHTRDHDLCHSSNRKLHVKRFEYQAPHLLLSRCIFKEIV
jgi:hypothetical protein